MEGLLWMSTRHPMGPRGVASKLKGPLKSSHVELADGFNLFIYSGSGSFLEGAGEEVKGMEEAICMSGGWLREVVMAELNCVGDKGGVFGGVDDLEAVVVLQGEAIGNRSLIKSSTTKRAKNTADMSLTSGKPLTN